MFEKGSTRWCQFDTASPARQQLCAYLVLKVSNLPTQGRLRRVQLSLCCYRQISRFGDRNKITQVS